MILITVVSVECCLHGTKQSIGDSDTGVNCCLYASSIFGAALVIKFCLLDYSVKLSSTKLNVKYVFSPKMNFNHMIIHSQIPANTFPNIFYFLPISLIP